jgi:hypothetical protein
VKAAALPVTAANTTCSVVDCHSTTATEDTANTVNWTAIVDTATYNDGLANSKICKACHDRTPSAIRIYSAAPALIYSAATSANKAIDAADSYYGNYSQYGRGGHGDAAIQSEDPLVDSASGRTTPIDCTACHATTATHYNAKAGANPNRLTGISTASVPGDLIARCQVCHASTFYGRTTNDAPRHHPVNGADPVGAKIVGVSAAITGTTSWGEVAPPAGHYEQNQYGYSTTYPAGVGSANVDRFIDYWGGNFDSTRYDNIPPKPVFLGEATSASAKVTLPLARYIIGGSSSSNKLVCTTCHNPHGTDLYVYDNTAGHSGRSIADNNMLRLRDDDSTLCNACH